MLKIMFLCAGNSCRSQMAEGLANALGKGTVEAHSAGTFPANFVHPKAIQVMNEIGIDISNNHSKTIDDNLLDKMDIVITLCGDAADSCPLTPPRIKKIHWGLTDPATFQGTDEEITAAFRKTRDDLKKRIKSLIQEFRNA
jgi:arsenate reductase